MPFLFRKFLEISAGMLLLLWAWRLFYPIEIFEFKLVEQFNITWIASAVLSRVFVGVLAFVGLWTLVSRGKTGFFHRILFLLSLLLGSFDIVWKIITDSVIIFCYGCPTNGQLWLNVVFLVFLWVVFLMYKKSNSILRKWHKILIIISLPIMLLVVYIRNPIFLEDLRFNNGEPFLKSHSIIPSVTNQPLNNTLLCCFSVDCKHCKDAARKIKVSQNNSNTFPEVFVVFIGDEERVGEFMEITNTTFDYEILEADSFFNVGGNRFPSIIYYRDRVPKYFWVGRNINYGVMDYLNSIE